MARNTESSQSNIRQAPNLLEKALSLRPVHYHLKEAPDGREQLGFIAQEVREVLPQMVTEGEILTLNYAGLSTVDRSFKSLVTL